QDKAPALSDGQMQFYEKEVVPILRANCYKCHGDNKPKGELRLTSREKVLAGGNSGPAVDLKDPDDSLLLKAIRHQEADLKMPPTGKQLPPKVIETLAKWVKLGLPMPSGRYWAYQPLRRPTVPMVKNTGWVRNPIDAFILAKLEARGLTAAAPADKVAL